MHVRSARHAGQIRSRRAGANSGLWRLVPPRILDRLTGKSQIANRKSQIFVTLRTFAKYTPLGRLALIPVRLGWAMTYPLRQAGQVVRWAFRSKEYYNHSY